jgi:hypothetical protein
MRERPTQQVWTPLQWLFSKTRDGARSAKRGLRFPRATLGLETTTSVIDAVPSRVKER